MSRTPERAFITGITGQDGSYLAEYLLGKGYEVHGLVRRSTRVHLENLRSIIDRIKIHFGDLIDHSLLEAVVAEVQPTEIYNLAAQTSPADSWTQPIVTGEITGMGVIRMLEAAHKQAPDAKFYQGTSREIFGGVNQEVMDEHTPFLANNPYGIAKLYGHLMMRNYRESFGMFAAGGILFNHESPRRGLQFITRKISMAAALIGLGSKKIVLNEHGEPLVKDGKVALGNLGAQRDWGYAKEYVISMWLMLQQREPKDYVIATNTLYSVEDFCREAFAHVGHDWQDHVVSSPAFLRPTEITVSRGDYTLAKKELGWEPRTSFSELVDLMVDEDTYRIQNDMV